MVSKHEIERVKAEHDCREIAGERTQLRGTGEKYGPCPKCGGDDRFHAKREWWMCRQCHEKWSDVIDLVRWLDGSSFADALRSLGAQVEEVPLSRLDREPRTPSSDLDDALVWEWLKSERNITHKTATLYNAKPSIAPVPGTKVQEKEKALAMPWVDWDGNTSGYRYRFIEDNGVSKMTSWGKFAGLLFGILWPANPANTLFVVEGELNAMSIRQVSGSDVDVVSIGSEGVRPTEQMRKYVKQFKHCIVWTDRPDIGEHLAYDLWADSFITPDGYDANDVLGYGDDALKRMVYQSIAGLV